MAWGLGRSIKRSDRLSIWLLLLAKWWVIRVILHADMYGRHLSKPHGDSTFAIAPTYEGRDSVAGFLCLPHY